MALAASHPTAESFVKAPAAIAEGAAVNAHSAEAPHSSSSPGLARGRREGGADRQARAVSPVVARSRPDEGEGYSYRRGLLFLPV